MPTLAELKKDKFVVLDDPRHDEAVIVWINGGNELFCVSFKLGVLQDKLGRLSTKDDWES